LRNDKNEYIYKKAIWHFGNEAQLKKTIEELNEVIVELQKAIDKSPDFNLKDLMLEIADVYNMLIQVCMMFSISEKEIEAAMDAKMIRTLRKISENS
jgi:NTP pyrophosphatase (non-canonical NTP hydrolase)